MSNGLRRPPYVMVRVYGLCDPRNGHLRYIGVTKLPLQKRLLHHLYDRSFSKARVQWFEELASLGLKPEIFEIETVPATEEETTEKFWIAYFRGIGADLLNVHVNPIYFKTEAERATEAQQMKDRRMRQIAKVVADRQMATAQYARRDAVAFSRQNHCISSY